MLAIYLVIFILGACLGSFYHVVGYRMPAGQNWVTGRSKCSNCNRILSFRELVPIISYLLQKGRCQNCQGQIKALYFWLELLSGFLFVLPVYVYGIIEVRSILTSWLFLSMLLIISVSDIYYQLILNKVLLFFGFFLLFHASNLMGALIAFLMMSGLACLGKALFKKEALGGGDIKLYLIIGLVLEPTLIILSLFLATLLALIYALIFVKDRSKPISFGPFIAISAYFCLFYGSHLISVYLNLLNL